MKISNRNTELVFFLNVNSSVSGLIMAIRRVYFHACLKLFILILSSACFIWGKNLLANVSTS